MADEVYLTPEERLSQLGDKLLSGVIRTDNVSKNNRQVLFGCFTPRVFKDENHILYKVLYNFKDRGIVPDEGFLRLYLMRNEHVILDAAEYIDVNAYKDLDENPVVGYVMAVVKQFNRLLTMPVSSFEQFNLDLEKYKLEYMCVEMGDAYNRAKTILYDGLKIGRHNKMGYVDSVAYVKSRIADVESVVDTTAGIGFIDASVAGLIDDDEYQPEKIGDFGLISELNKYLGGIYTSYFYSVLAPTKGGKSKFTTRLIHNIMVEHGNNVAVWAHEGGPKAWMAQLRATHYDWLYNRNEPDITKHKLGINQDVILKKQYPSEAVKQLEDASRVDLFTNPNYGNLHLIDRPFKLETFIDEMETAVQLNGAKVILIDYLQLISTDTSGISKPQMLGTAYQKALAWAKKRNVAVISPAQMTQAFMDEMARSKEGGSHELRVAGGETSEVVRTPDINIALYGSIEDIRAGSMKILSIPSRLCQPFPDFDIYCDLGVCQFASLTAEE